jgi:uncharacterized protein YecE (DUF72 family)
LLVGTSGWAYKEWKGAFYPADLPQMRFLEHYGRTLTACEVNATFYRLLSHSTFANWVAAVPESFRFAVKAHRRITHRKRIAPDDATRAFLDQFLASLAPLRPRLACVLLQFPPFVERDDKQLESLLAALPANLGFACEFRHPSWHLDEVRETIASAGGTVCLSETEGSVPDRLPPGPIAYVRLKASRYAERARDNWLALLRDEGRRRDVYAFAKHEGVPAGDPCTGVGLAQWLVDSISGVR